MKQNLHHSLRALFLSLTLLLSFPMIAEEIDGIYYDLDDETKQATVLGDIRDKYSGEVVIPKSVEHRGLTYRVTSIGNSAFSDCTSLTSVTIPNSVMSIGSSAFSHCTSLTSVTIPNSVKSIGRLAFFDCTSLSSVTIGNGVTNIGGRAFDLCSGLTSVHLSDIAAWCDIIFNDRESNPLFYADHLYLNGEEVKDLVIPNSVTSIGALVFYACRSLTSVTIPNSVTSIGNGAFLECGSLTSVTIGNGVKSIEEAAFEACIGLTSVTFGNSVTSIGDHAFGVCVSLTSVTIPNSVESIGKGAFNECEGLTSVTIGNGVTSIEDRAFRACFKLKDVYCYAEKVPSTKSNVFEYFSPEDANLHVPAESLESYKATAPWSLFGQIIALSDEGTGIHNFKAGEEARNPDLYDLTGRRVQKGQKGLFIQNGKKVILR